MSTDASSLVAYLEASAARHPDRIAVVDPFGQRLTYAELDDRANRVAGLPARSRRRRRRPRRRHRPQERGGRHGAVRHHEGRRRLRAGRLHRADRAQHRHPDRLPGQGRVPRSGVPGHRRRAAAVRARRAAGAEGRDTGRPGGDAVAATSSPSRRSTDRPALTRRRSRLHPLHVGIDRRAQGRDPVAPQRHQLRRLVLGGVRADASRIGSAATRRSTSTCRSSTSTSA